MFAELKCCQVFAYESETLRRCLMGRPKFAPKITPFPGPIPKPNYLSLTYHPKPHPYPFSRFSTKPWTDPQTNRWLAGMVCD